MKTYYHVTEMTNKQSILENGLLVSKGRNSELVEEVKKAIYLTDHDRIMYWTLLLGIENPVVFEVNINVDDVDKLPAEILSYNNISPANVSVADFAFTEGDYTEQLEKIRYQTMGSFSLFCKYMAQWYHGEYSEETDEDKNETLGYIKNSGVILKDEVVKRARIQDMSKEEIDSMLKKYADEGNFALTDYYYYDSDKYADKRIWEMLSLYPKDDMTELRLRVQKLIKKYFKDSLYTETGGM